MKQLSSARRWGFPQWLWFCLTMLWAATLVAQSSSGHLGVILVALTVALGGIGIATHGAYALIRFVFRMRHKPPVAQPGPWNRSSPGPRPSRRDDAL